MIIKELYDNIYPNTGFTTIRTTVRGLVFKGDLMAMVHIKCTDGFGLRDHFEIPGGGIEVGENELVALHREIEEELGYKIQINQKLGTVIDRWNYLERINVHQFYICDYLEEGNRKLTEYEKEVIVAIVWHTVDEWLQILSVPVKGINKLIHDREKAVLKAYLTK